MTAPDLIDPLIGYRAWRLSDDGGLLPWTLGGAGAWRAGVNRAQCHTAIFHQLARGSRHRAPAPDCMCGLYALADPGDRRLNFQAGQVVGAVAAWGDVEVHRTGFRAEFATVVALARPERADVDTERRLERAAARYRVPLVPAAELSAEACRHGLPLEAPVAPAPIVLPEPEPEPALRIGRRGIAIEEHMWVCPQQDGHVETGIMAPFAGLLTREVHLTLPPVGTTVEAGDPLATLCSPDGQTLIAWACVSGTVAQRNEALLSDPAALVADPQHAGWLARIAPTAWDAEERAFAWGGRGTTFYAASVGRARLGFDVFADLRAERLVSGPPLAGPGDVRRELEVEAQRPRFADDAELCAACVEPVVERLAADPLLGASVGRLGITVAYVVREPEARLTLVARDGRTCLRAGPADGPADLVLEMDGETAHEYFSGTLDIAQALAGGALRSSASRVGTLRSASLLKHLFGAGLPQPAATWLRAVGGI